MSTVMEVIAAVHAGMAVIGFSAITNDAGGGSDQQPDTIEDVLAHAAIAGRKIEAILAELIPAL
jgi:purine-nucleoside phosphorylase